MAYYKDKDYKRFTAKPKKPKSRFREDRKPDKAPAFHLARRRQQNPPSNEPHMVRRRLNKARVMLEEHEKLYKPVQDWDFEELERGRPRDRKGGFRGKPPMHMTRALHEAIVDRYKVLVKQELAKESPSVLKVIRYILDNDETDEDGKPLVAASTRLDAAKFVIEHLLGKPKQESKEEISITLQGILAHAMVQPSTQGFELTRGAGKLASEAMDEEEELEGEIIDDAGS